MNTFEYDAVNESGLIEDMQHVAGSLIPYQKVLAIGPTVRNIQIGDIVMINPKNYIKRTIPKDSLREEIIQEQTVIDWPILEINDEYNLLLKDNDIDFVIEDYDEGEEVKPTESKIWTPNEENKKMAKETKIIV